MPPTLFIKNAIRLAELGLGDGTIYASGSAATPNVAQKTFALTGTTPIADLAAIVDDIFNGYILRFPASGNIYHIVDYVAGTATVTAYETPASGDTGAFEIRRRLVENKSAAGNPAHRLSDGQVFSPWKGSAANQAQRIDVYLPNLIGQGGFEELAAGAFPGAYSAKGKWFNQAPADWAVSATSPLLGSRMAVWTPGGLDSLLIQALSSTFKKGRKYRLVLKAQAVTGATGNSGIDIYIANRSTGSALSPGFTGGNPWSLGAIGTSAAWFTSPDFTVDSDAAEARIEIIGRIANKGAATAVRIDEVYFWEQVNVGALAVFGHNWEGMPARNVYGLNCDGFRSGVVAGVDYNIIGNVQATGSGPYLSEFTPAIYPVYGILLDPFSLYAYEASEILLAEKWAWEYGPSRNPGAEDFQYDRARHKSRSGVVTSILHNEKRKFETDLKSISPADNDIWLKEFKPHHLDTDHPFAAKWDLAWGNQPVLWRNNLDRIKLTYPTPDNPDTQIDWEEV